MEEELTDYKDKRILDKSHKRKDDDTFFIPTLLIILIIGIGLYQLIDNEAYHTCMEDEELELKFIEHTTCSDQFNTDKTWDCIYNNKSKKQKYCSSIYGDQYQINLDFLLDRL